MAIDQTGWSELKKKLQKVLIANELANKTDTAYVLSDAKKGKSGFSFGYNQMDLSGKPKAREYLEDILDNAKDAAGKLIVSAEEKKEIKKHWDKKTSDPNKLSSSQVQLISNALSSAYGKEKVDTCFGVELDATIKHVEDIVATISDANDKEFLGTDLAKLFLADFHNQYNLSTGGQMHKYLKGECVTLDEHTLQKDGVFGWDDLMNFYSKTKYNLEKPKERGRIRAKNVVTHSGVDDQAGYKKIVDDTFDGVPVTAATAPPALCQFPLDFGKGVKIDPAIVKAFYEHTESDADGGYYPIGANTVWHGGLHLFANEGSDVVACMPGKIVAVRLGETEEQAKGPIGHSNFILMQHTVKGKPCYSLYMHLKENPLDESDDFIRKVGWLAKGAAKQLKIAEGKERNYRSSPEVKDGNVLGALKGGDVVDFIEDAPEAPWKKIRLADGTEAFVSFDAKAVSIVDSTEVKVDADLLASLKDGGIVKVDKPVKCGDLLWKAGSFGPDDSHKGMIHWEIFSADNLVECLKNANSQRNDELPKVTGEDVGYAEGSSIKVRGLSGPSKAVEDEIITLHVDKINYSDAPENALLQISWLVKSDDTEVERFEKKGRVLEYTVPTGYMGKTLKIYAYVNEPSERSCIKVEVLSGWIAVEDSQDDFNVDNEKIKTLFGDLLADNVLTREELVKFYSDNPGGRAEQLRKYACRFSSEWGIPDLDAAIGKLKDAGFRAKKENIEPYQWWKGVRGAGADLPESPNVWHYNPIAFLEKFGAPPEKVAVKSDDLKKGSYDDKGVANGKGKTDGEMHHQETPVVKAQQQLTDICAYSGAIDGWFYSKMEEAVCTFQEFAEKGQFMIDGVLTCIGDKLTGHQKGVIDDKTKAYMDKVTEKGGKIPDTKNLKQRFPLDKALRKTLPGYHNDKNGAHRYFGAERKGKDKDGNAVIRKHSGCDLWVKDGTPVYAIDDGVILDHYDFGAAAGHTWVLEVGHGEYTVRYGEITSKLPDGVKKGGLVKRGDQIAEVMLFPNGKDHMLHFEMYKGKNLRSLTERTNRDKKANYLNITPDDYERRKELMDPTDFLDNLLDE